MNERPLSGVRVLDLTTLLPGPLCTLLLAEAGAEVVRIERVGDGDEMRSYQPRFADVSANYAVLNRGKRGYTANLKDPVQREWVLDLVAGCDVVVEQFRPGVMDRLGLGYDALRAVNPGVVLCSITGYGQENVHAADAGHDLNYLAQAGILGMVTDSDGLPPLPFTQVADLAGGTYPAVINILLALRLRDRTGVGTHVDISMTHSLALLSYAYFAHYQATGAWPESNRGLLTGGNPRYRLYRTADGRALACAALEDRFWVRLLELVGLPELVDVTDQEAIAALSAAFAQRSAAEWARRFEGEDVCTCVVNTFDEAADQQYLEVDPARSIGAGDARIAALPVPLDPDVRRPPTVEGYPELEPIGESSGWAPRSAG